MAKAQAESVAYVSSEDTISPLIGITSTAGEHDTAESSHYQAMRTVVASSSDNLSQSQEQTMSSIDQPQHVHRPGLQRRKRWLAMSVCYLSAMPLSSAFQTAAPNTAMTSSHLNLASAGSVTPSPEAKSKSSFKPFWTTESNDFLSAVRNNEVAKERNTQVGSTIHMNLNEITTPATMFVKGPRRSIGVSKRISSSIQFPPYVPEARTSDRVLGFDVFPRTTSSGSSSSACPTASALAASSKSNVDAQVWKQPEQEGRNSLSFLGGGGGGGSLFPASWNHQQSDSMWNYELLSEEEKKKSSSTSSPTPSWFPWIPTKMQIETLKLTELRYACAQRELKKVSPTMVHILVPLTCIVQYTCVLCTYAFSCSVISYNMSYPSPHFPYLTQSGNKKELQQRLFDWSVEQQLDHQARLLGDWHPASTSVAQAPNSLAEWARTVDLEPLLNRRQVIHREKRVNKKTKQAKEQRRKRRESTNNLPSKEYLNALLKAPALSNNEQVQEIYQASKLADQMGETMLSMELLHSLLKLTPKDARIHRRLSRLASQQGNVSQARAYLQQGLRQSPNNAYLWQGLGQLESRLGQTKLARDYYQRAIQADPTLPNAYHALGTLEHTAGNIAEAMKVVKKGLEFCPENHRLWHALGDLYRDAKLLKDAERSYLRALELGLSENTSHCFSYSALAFVAYERQEIDSCRQWLRKAVAKNNGRHAQGWVALAQLEESEGNVEKARLINIAAIQNYEEHLLKAQSRYSKKFQNRHATNHPIAVRKSSISPLSSVNADAITSLSERVPRYRSGDHFIKVYRNWARLEERYGSMQSVDDVYQRAMQAFPFEYKLPMDWASYYSHHKNFARAQTLYKMACEKAGNRHADPYRIFALHEMRNGSFREAQSILFRGAQVLSTTSDGGFGNRGLPELYHTWAVCEWYLGNLSRAEVLLDNALRLTNDQEEGSQMRAYIFYTMAALEFELEEHHLAQHFIGLCLKENSMPGGNAPVWELFANVAAALNTPSFEEEYRELAEKAREGDSHPTGPGSLKQLLNKQQWMRREPWHVALFGPQSTTSHEFYFSIPLPSQDASDRLLSAASNARLPKEEASPAKPCYE